MWHWIGRRRRASALATLAQAHAGRGTFSGAVLVTQRGRTLLRAAYGLADLDRSIPNTPATSFRIGSVSKSFTATLVMRLAEAGKLSPDDALAAYLPDFPNATSIRLRHLLSNTSGIPDFLTMEAFLPRAAERHSLEEVAAYFRDQPLLFQPGSRFSYSNSNWTLLALVVERVTGAAFAEALHASLLEPFGLAATYVDLETLPNAALGYTVSETGPAPASVIDMSVEIGAGGLRSTIDDLARFDQLLSSGRILRAETIEWMRTPVAREGELGYGHGFFSEQRFGRQLVGHSGGTFGFTAFWSRYPADDALVVVLANVDNGSAQRLERDLGAALLGAPYELPGDRQFIQVSPAVLAPYAGRYRSQYAGRRIDFAVVLDGGALFAQFPLLPRARLQPLSEQRFFTRLKGGEVVFEFVRREGAVTGIAMDWSGNPMECPRIA